MRFPGTLVPITGLFFDGGSVYVADNRNSAIKKMNLDGSAIETVVSESYYIQDAAVDGAGNIHYTKYLDNDVYRKNADGSTDRFSTGDSRYGVAVDAAGNTYASLDKGDSIVKLAPDGSKIGDIIGLNRSRVLAVDGDGNVYVTDTMNNAVKKIVLLDPPSVLPTGGAFTDTDSDESHRFFRSAKWRRQPRPPTC